MPFVPWQLAGVLVVCLASEVSIYRCPALAPWLHGPENHLFDSDPVARVSELLPGAGVPWMQVRDPHSPALGC